MSTATETDKPAIKWLEKMGILPWLPDNLQSSHYAHLAGLSLSVSKFMTEGCSLSTHFKKCESPMEARFLAALISYEGDFLEINPERKFTELRTDVSGSAVWSQVQVKKYRLDFVVESRITVPDFSVTKKYTNGIEIPGSKVVRSIVGVEIDGHEFHERTKQQVAKDKAKERACMIEGFQVLRFSGSEVYNEPLKVIEELNDALWELVK